MFSIRKSNRNTTTEKMQQEKSTSAAGSSRRCQGKVKVVIEDMPSLCHIVSEDDGSTISSMSGPRRSDASFASAKDSSTENSESSLMVMNYLQARNDELKKANCQLEEEKERLRRQLGSMTGRANNRPCANPISRQQRLAMRRTSLANFHETETGMELVPKEKEMRITTKVTRPTKKYQSDDSSKKKEERRHSSSRRSTTSRRRTPTPPANNNCSNIESKASF